VPVLENFCVDCDIFKLTPVFTWLYLLG